MHIDPIQLKNKSNLIKDYRNHKDPLMSYFDYSPFFDYRQRVNDLKERTFKREELADALLAMNQAWGASIETEANIERLRQPESVVVIGGQQAGLLTGPLYTVNKIISILQFARQQENELNIPVIPVFWVAGEDHDYDEINHINIPKGSQMKKHIISQFVAHKYPVSELEIDQSSADEWLQSIFAEMNETAYTKELYTAIERCLQQSETYVDFFSQLIFALFAEEGLVLVDSQHPHIRQLQGDYFKQMITKQEEVSTSVYESLQTLEYIGYPIALDADGENSHLFYHVDGERILLYRTSDGKWMGKQAEVVLTTEELLETAKENPERLSNNVVTRPIMQELLFPTLSFIGGDGEISYWAVLKKAFHIFDINMPPVLPRLSFTYIDARTNRLLEELAIPSETVINYGVGGYKGNWLAAQQHPPVDILAEQLKETIHLAHEPFKDVARTIRSDIGDMAEENLRIIHREIDYLKNRMTRALEQGYANKLHNFDQVDQLLFPNGVLQERIWSPLHFINDHGLDFIKQLVKENCPFAQEHYLVHI